MAAMDENPISAPHHREQNKTPLSLRLLSGCIWGIVGLMVLSIMGIAVFFFLFWLPAFKAAQ